MTFSAALLLFLGMEAVPEIAPSHQPATDPRPLSEIVLPLQQKRAPTAPPKELQYLLDTQLEERAMQVRIQQRVIIRIPRSTRRQNMGDMRSAQSRAQNWTERNIGKCVRMNSIAGVQIARNDQMLLYLRDRRIILAQLEKACLARDFYSGFYLEQSDDGRLCVERDVLHARSGNKCELTNIRQLVPRNQ